MKKAYAKRLAIWPDIVRAIEAGFPEDQALEIPIPNLSRKLKDPLAALESSVRKLAGPAYRVRRKGDHLTVRHDIREIHRCSCGAKFLTLNGLKRHNTSGVHERYLELREILQDDCVRHLDLAKEYGLSRERIRQLANTVGLPTGRERQHACSLKRALIPRPEPEWLVNLRGIVEPMGLTVERLVNGHRWRVLLNGVECAVGKLILREWQFRKCAPRTQAKLQCPTPIDYKFALMHSPRGWFVFPRFALPAKGQTQFVVDELKLPGTKSARHHWREYLERWDLVGGKIGNEKHQTARA